jgi:hypothetical protein
VGCLEGRTALARRRSVEVKHLPRGRVWELLKDNLEQPGKVIVVNDADHHGDHIPDFDDGFDVNPGGENPTAAFVPMAIELP